MIAHIPLATPDLGGNEARYLNECIESNYVSSAGAFVGRFEHAVAAATGATGAVATCSGTAALHLALVTLGVGRDDLVMMPSMTFIASANAVAHCGAVPWLVDISADEWTLDPELVSDTLRRETCFSAGRLVHRESGRRVAAVMPVHTLGLPADMDGIVSVASEFGLPVLADAAAALGATYQGRPVARMGATLSAMSFNGNKTVTTGGGGAIVGDDEALLASARHLSRQARVSSRYEHDRVGFNYAMTNLQAAVGCAQMERVDSLVAAKRLIDGRYRVAFEKVSGVGFFPAPASSRSACWYSGLVLESPDAGMLVDRMVERLAGEQIESRPFWMPVHLQRPFRKAPRTRQDTCESLWRRILTLPCSSHLSKSDQDRVIEAVKVALAC